MERVETLINKLKEQFENGATKDKLLVTAGLLLNELASETVTKNTHGAVSVLIPTVTATIQKANIETVKDIIPEMIPLAHPAIYHETVSQTPILQIPKIVAAAEHKEIVLLNDILLHDEANLNDALKNKTPELSDKLKDLPVKDLRSAIGINDKYVFIHELFRSDEDMYDRSIKTINSFSNYEEADGWIKRELITKLCLSEDSTSLQSFIQLVKRRFS